MKFNSLIIILFVMVLISSESTSQGQSFGRPGTPTVSPYLDLLQRSNNRGTAFNYYRRFQPYREFRNNEKRLGNSIKNLQSEIDQISQGERLQKSTSNLGTTGHPTSFHNFGGYFQSR